MAYIVFIKVNDRNINILIRLSHAAQISGGVQLASAHSDDITILEGNWTGGAIGLWRFENKDKAYSVVASSGPWDDESFAVLVPEREGASFPEPAAGFLLVQGLFTDPVKAAAYNGALPAIYGKFGGRYLVLSRAEGIEHLAGHWEPQAMVIAIFASVENSKEFWNSEDYRAAKTLREGAGHFLVTTFSGE